jgi:hypothetical protein
MMNALIPNCLQTGHCEICLHSGMTCCECGDAMVPWHPDIEYLWKEKLVTW